MTRRIILPQDFAMRRGVLAPTMTIERRPFTHHCLRCRRENVLVLPKWPGKMAWGCVCGATNHVEFQKAPENTIGGSIRLQLKNRPVRHECQDCGCVDWIVLPERGGDLRWECGCGSVWLLRWTPQGGRLARVVAGAKQVEPPPTDSQEQP